MPVYAKMYEDGVRRLLTRLKRFPKETLQASAAGQEAAAQDTMVLAKEYAPLGRPDDPRPGHPHALEEGAYVREAVVSGSGAVTVEMGFEGLPEPYMVKQHENVDYKHPRKGRVFFLKDAVDETLKQTRNTIALFVNHFIKTGRIRRSGKRRIPTHGA